MEGKSREMKILIIGGVAGGMSAATRLRRLQEDAEIIVIERGPHVSFANCGLPYYVSSEIVNRSDLIVQSSENLAQRFNLDIRENSEVVAIDSHKKQLTIHSIDSTYTENYDKLILSPGAQPLIPAIKGISKADNIFTLRNIPDGDKIISYIEKNKPKTAVVIGAGFIGLEIAESLKHRGLDVTLIEKASHVLPSIDLEMATFINDELVENQVKVLTNLSVVELQDKKVILENQAILAADLIILSVGISPESALAQKAGAKVGIRSGIVVDEHYETTVKDIYAVGDAILVKQQISGKEALVSLASPANRQGRQVADIVSGFSSKNKGSIGTAIVRTFTLTTASTGLSERQVKELGLPHKIIHITANDHASYYPDASSIVLKLIFNHRSGEIYGAQAVGKKGVDKRIDVLATAIKSSMTIYDLPELELTYAPPFGSAKDPVNMLGYAAMNLAMGLSDNIQWHELSTALKEGKVLLDVRNPEEIAKGAFCGSINIPLDELRGRLSELDKSQAYIVSCQSGLRSYNAERILRGHGFKVQNLDGAYGIYHQVSQELLEK